jgi:ribonuclease VapC
MIIDTSAILAIIGREPGHEHIKDSIAASSAPKMGAPSVLEAGIVLVARYGLRGKTLLARFLQDAEIEVVPFTKEHSDVAVDAFIRFGKGRHRAKLNLGDCHTYATASVSGEPLLFIGDGFVHTDLELVKLASEN